ncbi:hypothetical protein F4604DRAFT_1673786 [Suillus subluteus]|nr:hypothetical protein F4604DRAFT_1673786 [Suillus subluteus]
MLSKSFALFAAFAAFAPAFATPVPASEVGVTAVVNNAGNDLKTSVGTRADAVEYEPSFDEVVKMVELSRRDDGCSLVDIDGVIYDVLNNATISVLRRDGGCNVARATATVRDVVNKARANSLSSRSKRHEEKRYSLDQIEAIVTSAYDKKNSAVTDKRDDAGVYTIVERVLNNSPSKRGTYTISQVATATKEVLDANGVVSKRSDNVDDLAEQILDELSAQAAKRTDVTDVPAQRVA